MTEVIPIKKIPHPTEAGKYDLSEFVETDTIPAANLPAMVATVTGTAVDNADPLNPVINGGLDGVDGASAYQAWLNAGNTGTEADFLASLNGADGADGGGEAYTIQRIPSHSVGAYSVFMPSTLFTNISTLNLNGAGNRCAIWPVFFPTGVELRADDYIGVVVSTAGNTGAEYTVMSAPLVGDGSLDIAEAPTVYGTVAGDTTGLKLIAGPISFSAGWNLIMLQSNAAVEAVGKTSYWYSTTGNYTTLNTGSLTSLVPYGMSAGGLGAGGAFTAAQFNAATKSYTSSSATLPWAFMRANS